MNHYSGSYNVPKEWRPYYLSKALVSLGVNVAVISASFHHLHREEYIQKADVNFKKVDGVKFIWLKTPQYLGNGIGRIKNMFSYGYSVYRKDPVEHLNLNKPDVIIVSTAHPFHLLGGWRWARKYNAKLILEIRDAWPLSLNLLLGLSKLHPFSVLLSAFQFLGLKLADKVVGLPEGMKAYCELKGMKADKFIHVCNGIDQNESFTEPSDISSELESIQKKYVRVIMYTGSLGVPNAMKYCIDAMNQIENDEIAMVIIGEGSEKERLISSSMNRNIYFFKPVPKNTIQTVLAYADICIISWLDMEIYKYGISPNKLFDYMFSGKPIIQAINSPYSIIGDCNCGVLVPSENASKIKVAIVDLCSKSNEELNKMGKRGREKVLNEYTYDKLARKLLNEALD